MHLIAYTSEYTGNERSLSEDLESIAARAEVNNDSFSITGVLFYCNQRFMQIIEGSQQDLEGLMSILERDKRHKNITRIIDVGTEKRSLFTWRMECIGLSDPAQFNHLNLINMARVYQNNFNAAGDNLSAFFSEMLSLHKFFKFA